MTGSVGILGLGKYLPPKIVTNYDLEKSGLDTSHDWIVERTGIFERRIADSTESTSDLAVKAAQNALLASGIPPEEIDLIICATSTPDYPLFPSNACILQDRLHLTHAAAFDLSAACSGFNYAFTTAAQYILAGSARHVLVVAADCLSKYIDWTDRSVCILFGDGAGAAVVSKTQPGFGLLASDLGAQGSHGDILMVKAGGTRTPASDQHRDHTIYMNGKSVFKVAVETIMPSVEKVLKKAGISAHELGCFVPHQANQRIMDYVAQKLDLNPDQVFSNIRYYGNTSAASIPIALTEAVEQGRIKPGDYVLTLGFGAGFTWAANLIKWGGFEK